MHASHSSQVGLKLQRIQTILTRDDTDRGAASVRSILALLAFVYLLLGKDLPDGYSDTHLLLIDLSITYLTYSVLLLVSNIIWPGPILARRIISMLADTAIITFAMIVGGEVTSAFYGGYLWVTIANGLRYGRMHLYFTDLLSVLGFCLVLMYTPFWHVQITLGLGLLLWLILLPGYVSALLKRLENALHKAKFANKTKTDFLSNMSHELRTPLNVIISYSDLLEEEAISDGNRRLADDAGKIQQSANHLLFLINGILELSRIESDRSHFNGECFDIRLLLENIQAGMQERLDENENTFSIRYNLDQFQVYTDELKLKQVMLHVLDNANKFTVGGNIQVDVFSAGSNFNSSLVIQVKDNGIGIPAGQLSTIFEPFSQVDGTITRKYEGVGLGLTIAKHFIEVLGGSIDVRSSEQEGTTVTVRIPQQFAKCSIELEAGSQEDGNALHRAAGDDLPGKKNPAGSRVKSR